MRYGYSHYSAAARTGRLGGAAIVVALHAGVLAALWQLEPVRSVLKSSAPVMVKLVQPSRAERATPVTPPQPLSLRPRVRREAPRAAAPAAPTEAVAVAQPAAAQLAAAPETSAPTSIEAPVPSPAAAAPAQPPAPPPVVTTTAPRFNADYLNNPAPAYPPISRRMGEEGKVVLRVYVNERGLPDDVQVRTSSGSERLDATAQDTVRHWKFVPARRGESPVGAWVLVPISFSLRSSS